MKFIKLGVHNEETMKAPPKDIAERLEAHYNWLKEQKKAGRLLETYFLPQVNRNVTIWEFESPEEVDRHFIEDPMGSTFEWEIYPAGDVFKHIETMLPVVKAFASKSQEV